LEENDNETENERKDLMAAIQRDLVTPKKKKKNILNIHSFIHSFTQNQAIMSDIKV